MTNLIRVVPVGVGAMGQAWLRAIDASAEGRSGYRPNRCWPTWRSTAVDGPIGGIVATDRRRVMITEVLTAATV